MRFADELAAGTPNALGPEDIPRVTWLRGRALLALGQLDEAAAALLAAERLALTYGARTMRWRVCADRAALHLARRQREEAQCSSATARQVIAELAAEIPDDALRASFSARALAQLPAAPAPRRARAEAPGGLTPREREVAALVARGLSNRAIADQLVVGERTVETHVTNALGKLGFTSRAQIAAWAVAQHLI